MYPAAVRSLAVRLQSIRERNDWRSLRRKLADRFLRTFLRAEVSRVVWLEADAVAATVGHPDYTFRFLTADEVALYSQDPAYELSPAMTDRARAGRDLCFAALSGDKLAAFGWYALESIEPEHADGVALSYPPDVAFMYFGFTHPDFRGARLHGQTMALALQELSKRGVTKLVSMVGWTNDASLKSCWRLGYQDLGRMIAVGSRHNAFGLYPRKAKALGVKFGRRAKRRPTA
ncbi:MAG TPA: hypothetical protein VGN57_02360 [Pirellulaceae bacterium]|jgi:hypothetical protein|nr:hypothetical protein [Pirellulaceae bacterium]